MGHNQYAYVIHPALRGRDVARSPDARLAEAVGLVRAIDLDIAGADVVTINNPKPATLLSGGKVKEVEASLNGFSHRPVVVIVDGVLTPVQHRNLEKEWDVKVLDRTALILEIFGARAQTAEGTLQVELAHLVYQRSRLVRSWTHLERQRGGAGFLGGPGERQIESDRRALADKINRLKAKLEDVRRTRTLQRARRKRAPHPIVAFVGYTNAGKSTLFNRLTNSEVKAEDLLFATLDPTMRAIDLPSGIRMILSDTVGFISDLPTQLVAAFRATLEEVLEADVIVHVRDIAHIDSDAQRDDVISVLAELGVVEGDTRPVIEALNKTDLLNAEGREEISILARASSSAVSDITDPVKYPISAETGDGVEDLLALIERALTASHSTITVEIPATNGAAHAWLHRNAEVIDEDVDQDLFRLTVRISAKEAGQFFKSFDDVVDISANDAIAQMA